MKITPPSPVSLGLYLVSGFALLGLGCDKRELTVARPASADETFALTAEWPAFTQGPDAKLDILFMVDNSSSMVPLQSKLAAGFKDFMTVLENLPGGTPDLHIGVVSSSLGAGRNPSVDQCMPGGDRGLLQSTPLPPCTQTGLTNAFISVHTDQTTGQLVTNYGAQALSDVFSCIALLGDKGCGFEHQLASVRQALDPSLAPRENAGFLRSDALLAVILVTDEDDCSAPPDSDLFDSNVTSDPLTEPLGPLTSYRCNEFGHVCLIDGKLQHPPRTATGELQGCRSAEDGRLDKVSDFVTFLKNLKGDPARVFLAAVTGPATPYVVEMVQVTGLPASAQWPSVKHSCLAPAGDGDPAVRLAEAVNAFGGHGLLSSICDDSMGPILKEISTRFSRPITPACVSTPDPAGPGCTVVDRSVDDSGNRVATRLPACASAAGATPCWTLVDDAATCGAGAQRLEVDRGSTAVPNTLVTAIDCTAPHP